jgi:predicted phage tail protein
MGLVNGLNAIGSQVWAVVLILLGMTAFWMACACNASDVRAALMSSGTGMIGGGIAMFQHQEKNAEIPNTSSSVSQGKI